MQDIRFTRRGIGLAALSAALTTASAVHAQAGPRVVYVDAAAPAGGDGASWSGAFRDLQAALALAQPGIRPADGLEVRVARGVYLPDLGTGDRAESFVVTSAVTLMGGFAGVASSTPDRRDPNAFVSILSGDLAGDDGPQFSNMNENSRTVLDVAFADATTEIDGFTIMGGNQDVRYSGQGYWPRGFGPSGIAGVRAPVEGSRYTGSPWIRNCRITGCMAADNDIINLTGTVLVGCRVEGNAIVGNGAVVKLVDGSLVNCRVVGNRASGPGAFESCGIVRFISAEQYANSAAPPPMIISSLIADNHSEGAAAIHAYNASIGVISSTIAGNSAPFDPAIQTRFFGRAFILNCIVSGNVATDPLSGSRQFVYDVSRLTIAGRVFVDRGFDDFEGANSWNFPVSRLLSGDPGFRSPAGPDGDPSTWQDNDYRLAPGSQCIDRADCSDPIYAHAFADIDSTPPYDDPATPNRGVGFFRTLDLGAFEFVPPPCPADFNASGTATVADIFDFLTVWFTGSSAADFNHSGATGAQDLLDFLAAWFRGC